MSEQFSMRSRLAFVPSSFELLVLTLNQLLSQELKQTQEFQS